MSSLIVEVCAVEEVKAHPGADRLCIARVKGWEVAIQHDPETGKSQFTQGQKCVYIPYDAVIPATLAHGPTDDPPGRLNVAKYCAPIKGGRYRVRSARLRGCRSFGIIMSIDPAWGDDPNWGVGTDVSAHYGITKWEPPLHCTDGDCEKPHARFHAYTDIEKYANFPDSLIDGEEVVFTEKIHGCLHADTKVMLANGEEIPISQIKEGYPVLSLPTNNADFVVSKVKKVIVQPAAKKWIKLWFDSGRTLICTTDHLILTRSGWKNANKIDENDDVRSI